MDTDQIDTGSIDNKSGDSIDLNNYSIERNPLMEQLNEIPANELIDALEDDDTANILIDVGIGNKNDIIDPIEETQLNHVVDNGDETSA